MTAVTANLILLLISSTKVVHFCKETKKICATKYTRVRDKKRLEKVGNLVKNSYLYR